MKTTKLLVLIVLVAAGIFVSCQKEGLQNELADPASTQLSDLSSEASQGESVAAIVKVGYKQTVKVPSQGVALGFDEVVNESRCPVDVVCVWEGFIEVALTLYLSNGQSYPFTLFDHPDFRNDTVIKGYKVALLKVYPERPKQGNTDYSDYVVTLSVENQNTNIKKAMGTVRDFSDLDGCKFLIETDEGKFFNPVKIVPDLKLYDGMRLLFYYREVNVITICMAGQTIEITKGPRC
ncbi:MAG: hypothetical protein HC896_08145, partial [Bacteroidales bacterium]|nr:hypothetical protein [Bacteroidales bacterium]